jgi:predicted kinase
MPYSIQHPTVCLVVGVPASGKTSVAEELVRNLRDCSYLSKDMIQSCFTTRERVTGSTYSLIQGPTFALLVSFTSTQLRLGKHPVVDAPFSINGWRHDAYSDWVTPFRRAAEENGARLAIVRCRPPDLAELRRRIEARRYEWDEWKLSHWEEFLKREPVDFQVDHDDVLEVVTDHTAGETVAEILAYLGARPH